MVSVSTLGGVSATLAGAVMPSSRAMPSRSRRTEAGVGAPVTSATYSFSMPYDGCVIRCVRSPSFVSSRRPSVSASRRPMGKTRGSAGTRSITVCFACGSDTVVTTPCGLLSRYHTSPSRTPIGTPSTSTRSVSVCTRRPRTATSPLTVTRPPAISSSATRLLPMPTRARTFCSRSPSRAAESSSIGGRGLIALAFDVERRVGSDAQTLLERLDDPRARHELAEGRQVLERGEPQLLEEHRCGAEQDGLPGAGIARDLGDVDALLQRSHHAVDVDAAD